MAEMVVMPKMGQSVEVCTVVKWHKREGDAVKKGDVLLEIETEKAVLEVESFQEGVVLKILVGEGASAPVGAPVAWMGQPGEPLPDLPSTPAAAPVPARSPEPAASAPAPSPSPAIKPLVGPTPVPSTPAVAMAPSTPPSMPPRRLRISPRARALCREAAVHADPIHGSGPEGRILEKDVREYLAAQNHDAIRITPAAKALATQEGIDIIAVRRAIRRDHIHVEDIERAIAEKPRPLSRMRQVIAQRLTQSVLTAPHFYVTVETDVTDLLALRKQLRQKGIHYSVTDFILYSCARALREFPTVNSTTDGRAIRWQSAVHLGLAVNVEDGLVVPVIRNADSLSLAELHTQAAELAIKAREGRLKPDQMTGGTFTISNMGMLDVEQFTAIINPGESAILAVASAIEKPVIRQGQIVIRAIMKLTLSSDHRLIDGALAARFVNVIRANLENIEQWNDLTLS